ncbi:tRNA 2-thiouridine(34) synthase MnmA [Acetobacteraceae bacterium]|nr:tRNA 2-thiouridine(34) synthase MnmA [Acetobacteraceae bacterium]
MRILVAMSGGVDSAVTAALLREQGHEVVGATLDLNPSGAAAKGCCGGSDAQDAAKVAERMGFPHYIIDATQRFKESVVDVFAAQYAKGETPVPCVNCNQGVKFTDLLTTAKDLGCEGMATGHYVRKEVLLDGRSALYRPVCSERDQSWFLFATTYEQLEFLHFPLGNFFSKEEVRAEAQRLGLKTVASKADSQDICFVNQGSYADLVEKIAPTTKGHGEIIDLSGNIVGEHEGIVRYTIGQSKGLGNLHTSLGERQMVVRIEADKRRLVIAPRRLLEDKCAKNSPWRRIYLKETNWLIEPPLEVDLECAFQLRARERPRKGQVRALKDGRAEVFLEEAALPAPGQACVFYDGDRILGGGFIEAPATFLEKA